MFEVFWRPLQILLSILAISIVLPFTTKTNLKKFTDLRVTGTFNYPKNIEKNHKLLRNKQIMKKLLYTIGFIGVVSINTNAQTQPPNAGFENWETVGIVAEDPIDWSSSNEFEMFGLPVFSFKTVDANSGNFALRIISDTATLSPPFGTYGVYTSFFCLCAL